MSADLPKKERISGKTTISKLLKDGNWGSGKLLRYCICKNEGSTLNRIMVSVPKKNFKRAVKRNLLKRRIRESYRTQKDLLPQSGYDILFFYTSTEVQDSTSIAQEMAACLTRIGKC